MTGKEKIKLPIISNLLFFVSFDILNITFMTATAHLLTAGIIASTIASPPLGLTLAFISHPILDKIPHWDFGWGWRTKTKLRLLADCIIDMGVGLVITYLIFGSLVNTLYLSAAAFLSIIWDLLEAPYWFFKWKFPPFSVIYNIQSKMQGKAKLPWGIITQVVTVGGLFVILSQVKNLL